MLSYGSLIVIAAITVYGLYYNARRIDVSAARTRALVGAVIALLSGAAFGLELAQAFHLRLIATAGIGLAFAAAVGCAAQWPLRRTSAARGILAGWLGAMAGSAAGTLLYANDRATLVAVVALIVCVYLLLRGGDWLAQRELLAAQPRKRTAAAKRKPQTALIALAALNLIAMTVLLVERGEIESIQIGQPTSQTAVYDEQNDLQTATIEVTTAGFIPRNTVFKAGGMIKAVFHVETGSGWTIQSPMLGVDPQPLKQGDNLFLINNPKPGTYEFTLGTGPKVCTFTVQ